MSQKLKNLIKGIIVIGVFAIVLHVVTYVLTVKSEDGIIQLRALYKQKKNTVDVVCLGSSKGYCMLDTGVLWDEAGIACFDTGGAEAPSWVCYYYMKELLKTQHPDVILFETTTAAYRNTVLEQPEVWSVVNDYGFHWNKNRIDCLKDNTASQNFYKLLFPLGSMHKNYSTLTKNDFFDENDTINHKGFDSRETVIEFDTPNVSAMTTVVPCEDKHIEYLQKMIDLANENGIKFVVMVSPYYVTEEEESIFNYIGEYCVNQDIEFIDFNRLYDEIGLDFKTDMAENIHVNLAGSKKWSTYVAKMLRDNYGVKDRRGDSLYSSWDVDALWNRQDRLRYDLNQVYAISDITNILSNNDNYIVYITMNSNIELLDDENRGYLNKIGVKDEMITPSSKMILFGNNTVYSTLDEEFKAFIDENSNKLLFKNNEESIPTLFVSDTVYTFNTERLINIKVYDKVLKKIVLEREY